MLDCNVERRQVWARWVWTWRIPRAYSNTSSAWSALSECGCLSPFHSRREVFGGTGGHVSAVESGIDRPISWRSGQDRDYIPNVIRSFFECASYALEYKNLHWSISNALSEVHDSDSSHLSQCSRMFGHVRLGIHRIACFGPPCQVAATNYTEIHTG